VRRTASADTESMEKPFELQAREEGQTMAEYATVLTVITIACLTAFALLTASATDVYTRVAALFS
jgi:Flp pilus assembly pilin Flp